MNMFNFKQYTTFLSTNSIVSKNSLLYLVSKFDGYVILRSFYKNFTSDSEVNNVLTASNTSTTNNKEVSDNMKNDEKDVNSTTLKEIVNSKTLKVLTKYISLIYKNSQSNDQIESLTSSHVKKIKKKILSNMYDLSYYRMKILRSSEIDKFNDFTLIKILNDSQKSSDLYICILPCASDILVYMSIGLYIKNNIKDKKILSCNNKTLKSYYSKVLLTNNVKKLFIVDLRPSLTTINIEGLLDSLSSDIQNGLIMKYVQDMINLPIDGFSCKKLINIPILTDVLLDYYLINLDIEFYKVFPDIKYHRYMHEVIITFPENLSDESFEDIFLNMINFLRLNGVITSIGPDETLHPCYGGLLTVTKDGFIKMWWKNDD